MFLEKPLLHPNGYRELTAGHPGHDLAKRGSVILRLHLSFGAFNAKRAKILAQSRQRPFVEKAGEAVRCVGEQLATSNSNEKGGILALNRFRARSAGFSRKSQMRKAKPRRVAAKHGNPIEHGRIWRTPQQHGEERVFPGARFVHVIERSWSLVARLRPQDGAGDLHHGFNSQLVLRQDIRH